MLIIQILSTNMSLRITYSLMLIVLLASQICAQAIKVLKPGSASIPGTVKGHCVAVSKNIRVCKIVSELEDNFIVEKDGQRIGSWPVSAFMGETSDFEVIGADLDGDRQPELIVANHDGTSQGLGVNYWTIAIFPNAEFASFQPPLTFSIEEYGSLGTFVPGQKRVDIFTTTWEWTTDPKGKRGEGLYLLGQWWQYRVGALTPIPHRPTVSPDNQTPISGVYPRDKVEDEKGFRYLGDAATGRIYPARYLPSQPEQWLKGKRATLRTYIRGSSEINVLWLEH